MNSLFEEVVCCGMERSGTTLTWQILCKILDREIVKTHEYVEGDVPVVYTYRHPMEAYFSLRRCFTQIYPTSVGVNFAIEAMRLQTEYYQKFLSDANNKRNVLFLKYEDYYYEPINRLMAIQRFLNKRVSISQDIEILKQTSIKENILKSTGRGNFGDHDIVTGLHGNHIDPTFKGEPGAILQNLTMVLPTNDPGWNSKIIKKACEVFGYN